MKPLTDPFNRRLSYLRLSVTDLCNYRCNYCLPNGYQGKAKPDELSLAEISTLVRVFAASGTRKIRLTGGEPTLRRDLADIIAVCKAQPQIENVALTTNAFKLAKLFPAYRAAGCCGTCCATPPRRRSRSSESTSPTCWVARS